MGFATINPPQPPDDDGDRLHTRKRINSSQGLAQPKAFSRTASQSKLNNVNNIKPNTKQTNNKPQADTELVAASRGGDADDEDWVSSSSAVPSPAAEPDDEEEDAVIYVNPSVNSRHHQRQQPHHDDSPPATPTRTNHPLPHQRQVVSHATEQPAPVSGHHYHHAPPQRHQAPTEPSHIHFAGEPVDPALRAHPQDPRIHHNGVAHHASPPPIHPAEPLQLSSSVIRVSDRENGLNGNGHPSVHKKDRSQSRDDKANRQSTATPQQNRLDDHLPKPAPTTQSTRPAVSGNGDSGIHTTEGDHRMALQRGFGPSRNPSQHPMHDARPQLAPLAHNSPSVPQHRPSLLRRDTTPTTTSRSPTAVDTPPRSRTPPASMTHDEMVANNNKRHSVHSIGGHRRPASLLQPSQSKRHSLSSRPGTIYGYGNAHGAHNPLSLLVRLNPTQISPLTAPPTVSPGLAHGEIDHESNYLSMSPTASYSGRLRKRSSVTSINSVATAPVVSTTSTIAMGSSASPTSALKNSTAILSSIAHHPPRQTASSLPRSDSKPDFRRVDSLQAEDGPFFVSQFSAAAKPEQGGNGAQRGKSLGRAMTGSDWAAHETAMSHRGILFESFNRLSHARPDPSRTRR
ncbi:hypothetical protein M408DRAFT_332226 [Serendipita vermifera MAFF 305830]|uniref:Uncharacterized protein n=1 Tax=Serendipita vermifera MAFF 305830 TaxID=933852 RepID=A0A0C3AUM8_SERVB|nr:hypothetical protein M408DRAFT_332226 [Serendipita vermifera MAFF 305830]